MAGGVIGAGGVRTGVVTAGVVGGGVVRVLLVVRELFVLLVRELFVLPVVLLPAVLPVLPVGRVLLGFGVLVGGVGVRVIPVIGGGGGAVGRRGVAARVVGRAVDAAVVGAGGVGTRLIAAGGIRTGAVGVAARVVRGRVVRAGCVLSGFVCAGKRAEEGVSVAVLEVGGRGMLLPVGVVGRVARWVTVVHQLLFRLGSRRISGDCTRRYATATIFSRFLSRRERAFGRLSGAHMRVLGASFDACSSKYQDRVGKRGRPRRCVRCIQATEMAFSLPSRPCAEVRARRIPAATVPLTGSERCPTPGTWTLSASKSG